MLTQLSIRNFGLLDSITVEPGKGLNVFTGETGAGKSILIDALRFALGARINPSQVRDVQKPCVVEAVFELSPDVHPVLGEHLAEEDVLIIQRTYTTDGKTRNKVNDLSVTTSRLRELGDHLVDLHGPHDHQMLFSEDSHLAILDRLSSLSEEKLEYASLYDGYHGLNGKLREIKELAGSRERELDILGHQVREMEQVPLDEGEYEKLLQEGTRAANAEKLHGCVSGLLELLDNDDTGINAAIARAFALMNTLKNTDESVSRLEELLASMQDGGNTLSSELNGYLDSLSMEPGSADVINAKIDIYTELLRKYGPSLEDVRSFYGKSRERYELLTDLEHNTEELQAAIDAVRAKAAKSAEKLSKKRAKAAKALENTIEKELKELGISRVRFECRVLKAALSPSGRDKVVFYISPNAGEDLKPLAEIVSSGEAARVMLALKKALTKVDPIPVLIFDEIDAQIGGRLGTVTGKKLKELSSDRQVLLITHLPQIASFGDRHFKVSKKVSAGRTSTEVSLIDGDERVRELAKMMSGEKESSISLEHARDMLGKALT